ncbi:MAG: serine/threonine protein kinase [Deltaproteobacteria bacterium]|nr:serine/threonine protein kinase [Deltaproteobacteria bacterium]
MEHAEVDRLVMKPTARRRLGKYVLLGRLGHGGMGKIYLAYAPGPAGIEKLLVVKRLHSHLTNDPVLVNSFLDEARLSMALNHPHIVSTFDVGDVEGRYFMVMEYIEGQNLGVVLRTAKRTGHYPASSLWAGLFLDVLDGLHAAHIARDARGRPLHIIHRDVSPQNILITYEGVPKLVDFGIAKAAQRVSETDAGVLKGKYAYMSPEQVRGEPLDPRSDVFAAGIVLWEMLAGRRLYKADTIVRSVERILTEAPISPVRVNAECNPEIAQVAFRALQKDREQRFASAAAFKEALEDAVRRSGAHVRRSDTRELMQQLFHDVIEKQRAVLEACLAAGDAQPVIGDDDEEPNVSSRPGADSESDVSLQGSRREEATTPSAARNSPLVTGDNEGDRERAHTSLQRRKSRTGGDAGLVADDAARAVEPPPASSSSPATASVAPVRRAQAAAFSPIEATATQPTSPGRPRRIWPWAVAALLVAAIGGGLGVTFARARAAQDEPVVVADPASPPQVAPTPTPPTPAPTAPEPQQPEPTEPAAAATDAGVAVALNAADAGAAASEPADTEPVKPRVTPREQKRPPRNVERPPPKERETAAVDKPPDDPAPGATGTLSLDTVPWTTVYLGGKKLGETPLVNVTVPAGNLELLLVNPEAGIKESYQTKVKAGAPTKVRLDLN